MEFSFEFDCPPIADLRPSLNSANELIDLDLANPRDRWFTIDHSSEFSIKKLSNLQNEEEDSYVVRRSRQKWEAQKQQSQVCMNTDLDTRVEWQQKEEAMAPIENPPKKKEEKKKVHFKRNILENQKKLDLPSKFTISNLTTLEKNHEREGAVTRSKSGQLVESKKGQSKDKWPCPMPTKIQRQWQIRNKVKWYDLSANSKKQAVKNMQKQQKEDKQGNLHQSLQLKPVRGKSKKGKQ